MSVHAIEMPPITDPLVLAYLRVMNTNPPPELQEERDALRRRFNELLANCTKHIAKEDAIRLDQLTWQRGNVTKQAKELIQQINELQQTNALHSVSQSRLQSEVRDGAAKPAGLHAS